MVAGRRLLAGGFLVACAAKPAPVEPPLVVAAMPAASSAPRPPMPAPPAPAPDRGTLEAISGVVAVFERSLNWGDAARAEARSSKGCWAKACGSVYARAKKDTKLEWLGDAELYATRATATMDILCENTRPCDRVHILMERDCAADAGEAWVVTDLIEDPIKASAWLRAAPRSCP